MTMAGLSADAVLSGICTEMAGAQSLRLYLKAGALPRNHEQMYRYCTELTLARDLSTVAAKIIMAP